MYLGSGTFTAVYGLTLTQTHQLSTLVPNFYVDKLILRIFSYDPSGKHKIDVVGRDKQLLRYKFIRKWEQDKKLFIHHIIDIYMYGLLINTDGTKIGEYVLTREYLVESQIQKLNPEQKNVFFKSLLEFLLKLHEREYSYTDLKFENIGCDIIRDKYIFVVIDYEPETLKYYIHSTGDEPDTYRPVLLRLPDVNQKINTKNPHKFIYRHLYGLLDIINILFIQSFNANLSYSIKIFIYLYKSLKQKKNLTEFNTIYQTYRKYVSDGSMRLSIKELIKLCISDDLAFIQTNYVIILKNYIINKYSSSSPPLPPPRQPNPAPPRPTQTLPPLPHAIMAGGNINYKQKYLKYKQKYLKLKNTLL